MITENKQEFPGFNTIEREQNWEELLIGGIWGIESDSLSLDMFNKFYSIISKEGDTRMGISTQFAGSDDIVLLIVSNADLSGFGFTLRQADIKIGIFRTSHSKLLDKTSKF